MIGVLLLLFGLGWLRKAVLRAAGLMALHDEAAIYQREEAALQAETAKAGQSADWLAGMAAFQAVLLEGLEVIFIVIAVGAGGHGLIGWAALGALAACVAVLLVGVLVHKPLAKVPENTLKFGVGVMLSSFGVFWTAEGLGAPLPGGDWALFGLAAIFLIAGLTLASLVRPALAEAV